ncbi:MAG: serine proteinase [Ruminococcaceae bacterium]|nr:serine proteinase [Oscillospiraceae bacterium]
MAFFEEFKARAAELAQAGVAKSKVLAEIAKLKAANLSEKETIHKAYLEMGRIYYAEKGSTPDAAYAASCARVTDAMAAIKANNAKINELKEGENESVVVTDTTAAADDAIVLDSSDFEIEDAPSQKDVPAE